jgi:FkbM family methyltransferase
MMQTGIFKPEYIYRPKQLMRRLFGRKAHGYVDTLLPWGCTIGVSSDDNVGSQIVTLGLYDLVITETLWRLCDEGENALDVGANIGYTTFVMAQRIKQGRIECFDPHPIIFQELRANVESLKRQGCKTEIVAHALALGPQSGTLPLYVPKDFKYHRGESSLTSPPHIEVSPDVHQVSVVTLDSLPIAREKIGVMKIDVEGFEIEVLKGGIETFSNHRDRDVVFEEHRDYPTDVTQFFDSHGYQVFRLDRKFFGPCVLPPDDVHHKTNWTPTNFLATIEPERAQARLKKSGWQSLTCR